MSEVLKHLDTAFWDADNRGQPVLRGLDHDETCELATLVDFTEEVYEKVASIAKQAQAAFARRDELVSRVYVASVESPTRVVG
jgi:hypothetical protein